MNLKTLILGITVGCVITTATYFFIPPVSQSHAGKFKIDPAHVLLVQTALSTAIQAAIKNCFNRARYIEKTSELHLKC